MDMKTRLAMIDADERYQQSVQNVLEQWTIRFDALNSWAKEKLTPTVAPVSIRVSPLKSVQRESEDEK